ncbi:hypothetical protein [Aureimonas leprariae]|uniref:Uncharacterized protein n=1 Tax=Plantimonas leprariae TaxID=2615207 RepID=A0A7V7PQ84_9HYPH|nr:hypothetical protein [Aureimonas leprariae]KAB0680296.1 hypothetical protein F6X38_08955 [Aureimonas leprariae]
MQLFFDSYPNNSGRAQFAPAFPDYVEDVVLAADTLLRLPIPVEARFAVFSFDGDVRVRLGDAATIVALPAATSQTGSGGELNPVARRISPRQGEAAPATHICMRAPAACTGSVSFYA